MARSRNIASKPLAAQERGRAPIVMRAPAVARTTLLSMGEADTNGAVGLWGLLMRPSALFCVSLLAFLVVSGMKLWESGMLDPLFGPRGADPIESGPIRFAPHARPAAKEYVSEPGPQAKPAAEPEDPAADSQ